MRHDATAHLEDGRAERTDEQKERREGRMSVVEGHNRRYGLDV